MKMIIRMFCAVALVAGALSLTACSKEEPKKDTKGTNQTTTAATVKQEKQPAAGTEKQPAAGTEKQPAAGTEKQPAK